MLTVSLIDINLKEYKESREEFSVMRSSNVCYSTRAYCFATQTDVITVITIHSKSFVCLVQFVDECVTSYVLLE